MTPSPPVSEEGHLSEQNGIATVSDKDAVEPGAGINEKALMRKIDSRLLPAVTLLYLCSFLDRSNGETKQFSQT